MALSSDFDLEEAWAQLGVLLDSNTTVKGFGQFYSQGIAGVWSDEWPRTPKPRYTAEFRDPNFPEADVVVEERGFEKRDPRNPNPQAGKTRAWVVIAGDRVSSSISNSVIAETKAKALHEKLLKAAQKTRADTTPNWGRF